MSLNSRIFHCSPDDVFDILEDGWSYATWVVGAARIREVDEDWPKPGSRIRHSVGAWPLLVNDDTSVQAFDRPRTLVLTVRAWPAGEGTVSIACEPQDEGRTLVTIQEDASAGPAQLVVKPVRDRILSWRNDEALLRLAYLAESHARLAGDNEGKGSVVKISEPR
jgi:uncharacterized protein YndB with AHSA1/START domain